MSLILTTLSDNTITVLNTDTNVQVSYTATRCKWSAHLDPPATCYVYYEDQLIAAVSDDPSLYPGSSILGAFNATSAVVALTAQPLLTSTSQGTSGGTASTVSLIPSDIAKLTPGTALDPVGSPSIIGLLKRLVELGQDDRDFTEIVLKEATGLQRIVVRQSVYNETTAAFSTVFVNIDGTPLVPPVSLPVGPLSVSSPDIEIVSFAYHALGNGAGYSVGDVVEQVRLIDTTTSAIINTLWFNRSLATVLATVPVQANLKPETHQLEDQIANLASFTGYYKIRLYYVAQVNGVPDFSIGDLIEQEDSYRANTFLSTQYTNFNTGLVISTGASIPFWLPIDYDIDQKLKEIRDLSLAATDPLTAPYVNIADSLSGRSAAVVSGGVTVDNTSNQLVVGLSPDSNKVQITGGGIEAGVINTPAVSTTPALVVTLSPNSFNPNLTPLTRAYTQLTDGSNNLSLLNSTPVVSAYAVPVRQVPNTVATPFFNRLTDGSSTVEVLTTVPPLTSAGLVVRQPLIDSAGNTARVGASNNTFVWCRQTDGTNNLSLLNSTPAVGAYAVPVRQVPNDVLTPFYNSISDGINQASVKGSAILPLLTDSALVVTTRDSVTTNLSAINGSGISLGAKTTALSFPVTLPTDVADIKPNRGINTAGFQNITDGSLVAGISNSSPVNSSPGLIVRQVPDVLGNTQIIASTVASSLYSRITDGTLTAGISTALPVISASGLVVRQAALDLAGNTQTISSTLATSLFAKITDGITTGKILASGVAPIVADPALVVSVSPNSLVTARGSYNASLPVVTAGQTVSLQTDVNGRLITVSSPEAYLNFGTTAPAADTPTTAGKKLYRLCVTNNTGTLFYIQLHSSATALITASVPYRGLIFRMPANSTFVVDNTTFSENGELIPNLRFGFSTTFVNYTAVAAAGLAQVSLNYKIEA